MLKPPFTKQSNINENAESLLPFIATGIFLEKIEFHQIQNRQNIQNASVLNFAGGEFSSS